MSLAQSVPEDPLYTTLDIGDKKYLRSYKQNHIIEKNEGFLQIYKYINIKV